MTSKKSLTPSLDGSLLIHPEPSKIFRTIQENCDLYKSFSFEIAGLPATSFREETRKELLSLSKNYTDALSGKHAPTSIAADYNSKIIQTGHQPDFSHPGVMLKYSLLDLICRQIDGLGINLAVDNDIPGAIGYTLPQAQQGDARHQAHLFSEGEGIPLEYIKAPDAKDVELFLLSARKHLSSPLFNVLRLNFIKWKNFLDTLPAEHLQTATDFLVTARRAFFQEKETRSFDLPVSHLSASQMFFKFFLHLARNAKGFLHAYNSELSNYRREHRVRYTANPFPDLRNREDMIELPFWFFNERRRRSLFVKTVKGERVLFCGGKDISKIPSSLSPETSGLNALFKGHIRPKAIPLTLFNRLFFSDIFIHGTGGGRYDRITDGIIQQFFQVSPPAYITATFTKFPAIPVVSQARRIRQMESEIRNITFNPDRYVKERDCEARKKHFLLKEINKPGADKKEIGIEIKEINKKLLPLVLPLKKELTEELSKLKEDERKYSAFMRRDFPYFFFDPEDIQTPVNNAFE